MAGRDVESSQDNGYWQTLVALGVMALITAGAWYLSHKPTAGAKWPTIIAIVGAFLILLGTIVYAGQSQRR